MTPAHMLAKMIVIAAKSSENQLDKGGAPYILHPLHVMNALAFHEDYELMAIAVGHDVMEDDATVTVETLRAAGFSNRIITSLEALTHSHSELYDAYIQRIGSSEDATLVKIEDIRHNSDMSRMKGLRPKDFERMQKYSRSYAYLKGVQASRASLKA